MEALQQHIPQHQVDLFRGVPVFSKSSIIAFNILKTS